MSVAREAFQAGQCYLTTNHQIARVERLLPEGKVLYAFRPAARVEEFGWSMGAADVSTFALLIERQIPCDWAGETDA